MGITLGVSLFAGVQIGGDSLSAGFVAFAEHGLGEIDADVSNIFTPLFVTSNTLLEEQGGGNPSQDILSLMKTDGDHLDYIDSISQRLTLSIAILDEETGSAEIGQSLVGLDNNETGFGNLLNSNNEILEVSNLGPGEVYIGAALSELIFKDGLAKGKNLTISTSVFSVPLPGNDSKTIPFEFSVKIVDIFEDMEKGREGYANFIATNILWLQNKITSAFSNYRISHPTELITGYGSRPISSLIIKWNDEVTLGTESQEGLELIRIKFASIIGQDLAIFYDFTDTRKDLIDGMKAAVDQIKVILNVFGSLIILAGILVIINIQSMALASREKETGILRAIGAKRKQIVIANLAEALMLGVIGSVLGLLGGLLYGKILVFFMGWSFGFPTGDIPTVVEKSTLYSSFIAGFLISQITGIVPSINASRINVAQVLRGLTAPNDLKFGKKSLYFGIVITIFAIWRVLGLDPNPIFDGKRAFEDIEDTEAVFLPIASLILGPSLLFAYYRSKKLGITVFALFILVWANYNIFVIFKWIKTGNGGLIYVLYLIVSLVVGSIILFGMNLAFVSTVGQKITSFFVGSRNSPLRGTSMVAFQKMTSKTTRSTLTFALFATILTLNIFIGTWSFSFRYGFDQVVVEVSSGSDILIFSDTPIPDSLNYSQELIDEFDDASTDIRFMRDFSITTNTLTAYLELDGEEDSEWDTQLVVVDRNSLYGKDNEIDLKFNLLDNKTSVVTSNGTEFELYESDPQDPAFTSEDELVWESFVNNETLVNSQGNELPMIITSFIFEADNFNFKQIKFPGDSIFLNLTGGGVQEFIIGSIVNSNPLLDFSTPTDGPPTFNSVWFVNDYWGDRVEGLAQLSGLSNIFLGKSSEPDITSNNIDRLITDIEIWSNQKDGDFRKKNNVFYGIVGVPVYDIYEVQLEGQYRFFLFLQAFVSLGFVVGILGLLVVAFRSVAERTREIGMLRALGFRRVDVVISVVLELVVMSLIGLFIGFINGTILGYALTDINSGGSAKFLIPWSLLGFYAALTVGSAILASIFPAIKASRIPPSEALRYTG
ncbi:MAG: Macrolide export ATP-binding/permease protein MacB [Candidatus Heimdallarchaeota archaeon LC_2]|nr:MAG: Macrolide export ATP-binding/permease protein MacB [Candidatus Heimdallarchaeota archaeon LC_2]